MKTANELISKIKLDRSNLEHITNTGQISGSLLVSLREAFIEYAEQAIDQCAKENYDRYAGTEEILNVKKLLK